MPNAAAIDSRFMTAAFSGTTRLRNTSASSMNESSTTTPMNNGSFEVSTSAKSVKIAVIPPTYTVAPEPLPPAGSRRRAGG